MIKRNKVLCSFLSVFLLTGSLCAATPEETEAGMNRIKLDERFVYGENFSNDMETAYTNALSDLVMYVNEIRAEKGKDMLTAETLKPAVKELRYSRGGRHTVFLYLPLAQVTGEDGIVIPQNEIPVQNTAAVPERLTQTDDILTALCNQDNWVELKGLLIDYKKQNRIALGTVKTADEVPEDAYSILVDNKGNILAILSPKTATQRINHKTNLIDDESNHKDCIAIIWYR